jgi:hypothetical protein
MVADSHAQDLALSPYCLLLSAYPSTRKNCSGTRLTRSQQSSSQPLASYDPSFTRILASSPPHHSGSSTHIDRTPLLEFHTDQNAILETQLSAGDENAVSVVSLLDFRNDGDRL